MKCTLIVTSGKERSQRSCEMLNKPTSREELLAFLKAQDLRLEAGGFDFAVSLDGVEATTALRTDADVRLFLAQAKQMGDRATFHIRLCRDPAAPPDMESFLSAEYAVDLDLVTLHIFPPTTTPSSAPRQAFQEKMFVVPTRYVLDGLQRAVRDAVADGTGKKHTRLSLLALASAEDPTGTVLADDTAALSFLHGQAKLREPARLTYAVEAARTPTARSPSAHSPSAQSRGDFAQKAEPHTPAAQEGTTPKKAAAAAAAAAVAPAVAPSVDDDVSPPAPQPPATLPPPPSPPPLSPTKPPPLSTAVPTDATAAPNATPPSTPPHQTTPRGPATPGSTAEALVEVRMGDASPPQSFTFLYLRREIQLCRRFTAECVSRFALGSASALTLSSDPSVVIDNDGLLRELLALAREAQQPLRVRLHALSPSKPRRVSEEKREAGPRSPPRRAAAQLDVAALSPQTPPRGSGVVLTPVALPAQTGIGEKKEKEKERERSLAANGDSPSHQQMHQAFKPAPSPQLSGSEPTPPRTPDGHNKAAELTSSSPASAPAAPAATASTFAAAANADDEAKDAGGPSATTATTRPPPTASPSALHSCFSVVVSESGGDAVGCRVQVAARWGRVQRMLLCRVRRDHLHDDLRSRVADCFRDPANGDGVSTNAADMTMDFVYMDGSEVRTVALTAETSLAALPACLFVETTELRVRTPTAALLTSPRKSGSAVDAGDGALLGFVATASLRQLEQVSLPFTAAEVHTLMTSLFAAQATAEPYAGFLAALRASWQTDPPQPSGATPGGDIVAASEQLRERLQRVVTELGLSSAQAQAVLQEAASSLLCADLRDEDGCLGRFFGHLSSLVRPAAAGAQDASKSLQTLWQQARRASLSGQQGEVNGTVEEPECPECVPTTSQQWRTAYLTAPSVVLDALAAAQMDGLLPPLTDAETLMPKNAVVWREAFHKAQLQFCEMVTPSELEEYIKGDEKAQSSGGEEGLLCRSLLLSCIGALLAPAVLSEDYSDWLVGHFRGRVGAVLYAKMGSFDSRTALSLPGLISLSWTLLHPSVLSLTHKSAHPELVERLLGWARVAAAHACHVRHTTFPPHPLLHVHTATPLPLPRWPVPPAPSMEDADAVVAAPTPPAAPSPPSEPPPPMDRRTPRKRVHYVYKYNLNALHRPRSSAT